MFYELNEIFVLKAMLVVAEKGNEILRIYRAFSRIYTTYGKEMGLIR